MHVEGAVLRKVSEEFRQGVTWNDGDIMRLKNKTSLYLFCLVFVIDQWDVLYDHVGFLVSTNYKKVIVGSFLMSAHRWSHLCTNSGMTEIVCYQGKGLTQRKYTTTQAKTQAPDPGNLTLFPMSSGIRVYVTKSVTNSVLRNLNPSPWMLVTFSVFLPRICCWTFVRTEQNSYSILWNTAYWNSACHRYKSTWETKATMKLLDARDKFSWIKPSTLFASNLTLLPEGFSSRNWRKLPPNAFLIWGE